MNPICIISARGGSKRLPGKNKVDFVGAPIITYPIKAARDSCMFSNIIVSSDDIEIEHIAIDAGASAFQTPADLAGDETCETSTWYHILSLYVQDDRELPEYFCALYPTAAFITADDIKYSYKKMRDSHAHACMGVSTYELHPFRMISVGADGFYRPDFPVLLETDSHRFPEAYACNGTLFWFKTEAFLQQATHWQKRLEIYVTESVDIDTPEDLQRARERMEKRYAV